MMSQPTKEAAGRAHMMTASVCHSIERSCSNGRLWSDTCGHGIAMRHGAETAARLRWGRASARTGSASASASGGGSAGGVLKSIIKSSATAAASWTPWSTRYAVPWRITRWRANVAIDDEPLVLPPPRCADETSSRTSK